MYWNLFWFFLFHWSLSLLSRHYHEGANSTPKISLQKWNEEGVTDDFTSVKEWKPKFLLADEINIHLGINLRREA